MDESAKHTKPCPLPQANIISQIFFWWLNPIFKIGYKRSLEVSDMYNVTHEDSTNYLSQRLTKEWDKELDSQKSGKKPSLRNAIIRTFRARFMVYGIVVFLEEATKVLQPILLGGLIRYFAPGSTMETWEAYSYAGGVAGCAVLLCLAHHPYFFNVQRIGMWMRVSACALIYNKSLKLSSKSLGQTTTGHIVNLMSNDVVRFDFAPYMFLHYLWVGLLILQALFVLGYLWYMLGPINQIAPMFLHYLWVGPLQALFVLGYLWYMLGPTSIVSFVILVSLIPVQGSMGKLFTKLRRKVAVQTDERVRLMNEILTAMRVIKMYCWEKMFGELVKQVRQAEIEQIFTANYMRAAILAPLFGMIKFIVYALFLAYYFTGQPLKMSTVFTVIGMYNWHVVVMQLFIPNEITWLAESITSIGRIQKFLLMEELEETTSVVRPSVRPELKDCKITALNIGATWDQSQSSVATLSDISFEVKPGELVAVIGPVGAGKSSLLMALLGELPLTQGSIKLHGKVAYASQEPWVFSSSIRQNILFGSKYDQQRYQLAIKASALNKDLDILPNGDQTLVGERGVSLSGGQKARVSLARAVYFDADIYLLDDPLSAVDTAVGRHLFDKCICGVLKSKPRVLVTHQLQYLKSADKILILKEGKVLSQGTFDELAESGVDFSSLLKHKEEGESEGEAAVHDVTKGPLNASKSLSPQQILMSKISPSVYSEVEAGGSVHLSSPLNDEEDEHNHDNPSARLLVDSPDKYLSKSLQDDSHLSTGTNSYSKLSPAVNKSLLSAANSKSVSVLDTAGGAPYVQLKDPRSADGLRKRPVPQDKRLAALSRSNVSLARSVENVSGLMMGSVFTLASLDDDIQPDFVAPVQEEEKRAQGTIQVKYYFKYFYSGGGVFGLIMLVLTNLLAQSAFIMSDWWLSYWATKEEERQAVLLLQEQENSAFADALNNTSFISNITTDNVSNITTDIPSNYTLPDINRPMYIYIYTAITASVFIFGLVRALLIFKILIEAGRVLHNKMFAAIVRCPVLFFDTNPVGRILNRFSKDMGLMDENLPLTMFDFIQCGLMILGYILVAGIVNPWVFIPTAPLVVLFIIVRKYYLATSRDIKRLEGTTRSPIYSHMSATLLGLHTIRAYQVQPTFIAEFESHQDMHSSAWFLFLATSRWFAVRLDWLCAGFVTSVAVCSVAAADSLSGGLVGLTMTYAMALMGLFQWGVRQSAEVENQMTSVERVFEYAELPPEAPLESTKDKAPPPDWPSQGVISAEGGSYRYSEDGVDVLRNLRFCVQGQEKVGICGRTGAGKSSLIAMLFRLAEPSGVIRIDGRDIRELGLHDLRRTISIIPQDPMLFNGTVRKNLDPFNQHTDEALWNSLAEVQLKPAIVDLTGGLEGEIVERGANLSVGQRQLLCLARAVLKRNKILVIDEATANVDPRTDSLIQETIRVKFAQCTVLTIAHRLHTIMDSDRVMVLSEGEIVEFDEPYLLLQNTQSGLLHKMVEQTGPGESEHLTQIARETFEGKHGEGVDLTEYVNKVNGNTNGSAVKS